MLVLGITLSIGLVLCYFIIVPFIPALVWSLTLTVLFAPAERILRRKIGAPWLSATLTLFLAAILVIGVMILISGVLIDAFVDGTTMMEEVLSTDFWAALAHDHPELGPAIHWIGRNLALPEVLSALTTQLGGWSASVFLGSLSGIANLLLTFYFLFYLLRDRRQLRASTQYLLPLSGPEFSTLVNRATQTILASAYGTVAVAILQGILGGLMFWWLDLPSPVFWGVIMGLLAVVPFLGAFLVWVPAAVALVMEGRLLAAAVLVAWGTIVVGLVDNLVYPILVGRQLAMHSMLSFVAIIGGLLLFGAHGIVLGPLIVALSQALLEIWRDRLDSELALGAAAN
jgi:predicted PurR-regulated permease PerM